MSRPSHALFSTSILRRRVHVFRFCHTSCSTTRFHYQTDWLTKWDKQYSNHLCHWHRRTPSLRSRIPTIRLVVMHIIVPLHLALPTS